jgi:hypothetical protein
MFINRMERSPLPSAEEPACVGHGGRAGTRPAIPHDWASQPCNASIARCTLPGWNPRLKWLPIHSLR